MSMADNVCTFAPLFPYFWGCLRFSGCLYFWGRLHFQGHLFWVMHDAWCLMPDAWWWCMMRSKSSNYKLGRLDKDFLFWNLCWDQPTDRPRYRLQDGSWPNHNNQGNGRCQNSQHKSCTFIHTFQVWYPGQILPWKTWYYMNKCHWETCHSEWVVDGCLAGFYVFNLEPHPNTQSCLIPYDMMIWGGAREGRTGPHYKLWG